MYDLIGVIKRQQKKLKLTDNKMAEKLNISHSQYNLLLHGNRQLGAKALSGIVKNIPEIQMDVLEYLRRM